MIAVCLLTADRREYTETTLRTFTSVNDVSKFTLLHGDDASLDSRVRSMPASHGFETVVAATQRRGWLPMRIALYEEARRRGAHWVIHLENDVEWVRPFPWETFTYIASKPQFYCLRLYGEFKDRDRREPSFIYNKGDRTKPVRWVRVKYAPEPVQAARIHWSAQPSVTKIGPLLDLHRYGMESSDFTARVRQNVTYHIGVQRTRELAVTA